MMMMTFIVIVIIIIIVVFPVVIIIVIIIIFIIIDYMSAFYCRCHYYCYNTITKVMTETLGTVFDISYLSGCRVFRVTTSTVFPSHSNA